MSIDHAFAELDQISHQFQRLTDEVERKTAADRFTPPVCANPEWHSSREPRVIERPHSPGEVRKQVAGNPASCVPLSEGDVAVSFPGRIT